MVKPTDIHTAAQTNYFQIIWTFFQNGVYFLVFLCYDSCKKNMSLFVHVYDLKNVKRIYTNAIQKGVPNRLGDVRHE